MKKILLILFSFVYAFAGFENYNIGTWNLQGSSAATTESKWTISIRQLITGENPLDILMVQEAGTLPSTAVMTQRHVQPGGIPIDEYTWNLGTLSRPNNVFIYYSRIDVGANRVNFAIVSRQMADEVIVIQPPTVASRPIVGIRIGNEAFLNIHAIASGGTDAGALVTAVDDYFRTRPNINWMVAGDFNREPLDTLRLLDRDLLRRVSVFYPPSFTQTTSRRTIDYAIVGNAMRQTPPLLSAVLMFAGLRTFLASDHYPVNFRKF
ncbi:cytolethal distending toxin subunit B family protein [Campylobacter volucris]|uniref:Cytolethal distending toxin subunit B family protein n=1 Tax=Campylobacter volucris TaxID=1031542 RepID=A0AAE6CYJ8_9BACT|nr:cytolethal distending toxin subunit B family protein [Campylobacter volucris]AJC94656.1 cytolethal distending toxin, subunit CdtB [Campylobacter volucris LMG 24379]KAB0579448.1 cytolethal distending toxin subunit B family protein [Campylobacter volucris]MBF7045493.1 cytolethal distending toxin subunit B family protein [Campylobacter volucris]QBL12999.1 cytolethal distending toxin subunit B family protein [Campylobacter volucris]QEL08873.1 cytolethal distending toxin, subunit CdtB [Campyloba